MNGYTEHRQSPGAALAPHTQHSMRHSHVWLSTGHHKKANMPAVGKFNHFGGVGSRESALRRHSPGRGSCVGIPARRCPLESCPRDRWCRDPLCSAATRTDNQAIGLTSQWTAHPSSSATLRPKLHSVLHWMFLLCSAFLHLLVANLKSNSKQICHPNPDSCSSKYQQ